MNPGEYAADVEAILARRQNNGADYWAGPEGKIYVGNPFSTLGALNMLHELGVDADHEAAAGGLALIAEAAREDGRIRLGPKSPMHPCYTAEAARILCRYGLQEGDAARRAVDYFMEGAHGGGGWRCNFRKFGSGPETECANPGATLYALDVLRFHEGHRAGNHIVDDAVDFLLGHWETRSPLGPCHWGIGTLFLRVEYPFLRYNLFYYCYILSFFDRAKSDSRFRAALGDLETKLDGDGNVVVERPHRALKGLAFCARGEPSVPATRRFAEIRANLAGP